MAFTLLSRSSSKPQGSVRLVPQQKSARGRHAADSRFGFAKPVFQPPTTALPTAPVIRAKLKVGEPNDKFEQEADRVVDEVMRMPDSEVYRTNVEDDPGPTQPSRSPNGILAGSGKPLPDPVRVFFESRFGHDFSRVRVHADAPAAQSARALGARAYTLGQDVVLGGGQYAPETKEGRRLLAHELTHVVQQSSGGIFPMIQRHLIVHGDKKDIKAFLGLLEPASGLSLKHDPGKNKVSVSRAGGKPPSPELASELQTIMEDPQQDAELNLGRQQEGVRFGAFPHSLDEKKNIMQEIRIDQILALEKGAPGSGVVVLAHEIIENYHAHNPETIETYRAAHSDYGREQIREGAFLESHGKAIEKENLIAGELGHPKTRRNDFELLMGREPHKFIRGIRDEGLYFLVWDRTFDDPGNIVSHVRRVPRIRVSRYTIEGFTAITAYSAGLSEAGLKQLDSAAADLVQNPTASALVECLLSVWDSPRADLDLPKQWAETVQSKLEEKVDRPATGARSDVLSSFTQGRSRVVITIDRPDI
jgi:hypothetical protein